MKFISVFEFKRSLSLSTFLCSGPGLSIRFLGQKCAMSQLFSDIFSRIFSTVDIRRQIKLKVSRKCIRSSNFNISIFKS